MKSTEQILKFICDRIGHIYFRPQMYGGDSIGVDLILLYYHELWSEIHGYHEEYLETRNLLFKKEGCGSAGFSIHFRRNFPDATEEDALQYVIKQWKKLSADLNVPIDYNKLSKQLNMAMP